MVTAPKGGGRGDKRFLHAIPSNCEILHHAAQMFGRRLQRIIIDPDYQELWDWYNACSFVSAYYFLFLYWPLIIFSEMISVTY